MTPTEEKAILKAKELFDLFQLPQEKGLGRINYVLPKYVVLNQADKFCDEMLKEFNSMKGMGKIHKVSFWKKVKENLKSYA